nr:immunoglobulin heavy chain junction region [Mus musculus]MBK4197779.1 immunoglobulin heavy chain junction region [Mus musculus]
CARSSYYDYDFDYW